MPWYEIVADIAGMLGFFLSATIAVIGWWQHRLKCRILDAEITSLLHPGNYMAFVLTFVVHNASRRPLHVGGASLATSQADKASIWRCAWDRRLVPPSPDSSKGAKADYTALLQELDASTAPPCTLAPLGTERISFLFRSRATAQLSSDLSALADQLQQWESEHTAEYEIDAQLPPSKYPQPSDHFVPLDGYLSLNGKAHPFQLQARFVRLYSRLTT